MEEALDLSSDRILNNNNNNFNYVFALRSVKGYIILETFNFVIYVFFIMFMYSYCIFMYIYCHVRSALYFFIVLFCVSWSCFEYRLCSNAYCTSDTGFQPNFS